MATLSPQQAQQFLERGYIHLPLAVPANFIDMAMEGFWTRLGYDEHDPSTWQETRIHMPQQRSWDLREVAPDVWEAASALVGGPERVTVPPFPWTDSFIVNLGIGADEPWTEPSVAVPGWHKDGDFFRHFLDSPEQGLLTLVFYTDVVHQGGATLIIPESVGVMARYLAEHPEGIRPDDIDYPSLLSQCSDVVEATGGAGDVYLLHPFILHAQSQNILRKVRVIANPPIQLVEPMRFRPAPGRPLIGRASCATEPRS